MMEIEREIVMKHFLLSPASIRDVAGDILAATNEEVEEEIQPNVRVIVGLMLGDALASDVAVSTVDLIGPRIALQYWRNVSR